MRLEEVAREIREISGKLYTGAEVVAGSLEELREVERLRGFIESYLGGTVKLLEVPLISWRLKGASLNPKPEVLAVAPYVAGGSVRSKWFKVEGDPVKPRSWRGFPEGYVAIVEEPGNPDDIKAAALNAAEAGASALIVESPNAPRKIVTNGYWGYNYTVGAPAPILVIVVEEGYSSKLNPHDTISVEVDAVTVESIGYTLTLDIQGSDEDIVMVGAHHDRWYGGFLDDVIGIVQAIVTAKMLQGEGFPVRLVIFTAEEHGAPGYASWYWAWGSRFYAEQLLRSNLVDNIKLFINYDMAAIEPLKISGSPQYTWAAEDFQHECCECPECDSFSLATTGIPTICIHSLWSSKVRTIYHTPSDEPDKADFQAAARAVMLPARILHKGPSWSHFEKLLFETLGEGPLEARRILYVIASLSQRAGWDKVYRELARIALKTIHYGSYRLDETELEASWFPEITSYKRLLKDIDDNKAPHHVWIAGEERILYVIKGVNGMPIGKNGLAKQYTGNIKHLHDEIERIQRELLR